ncbi:ABC transporter permease [Methanobacterium alcaliphilum]|uniref:ABC transporter permease n=1 Tax=Methanobacterium alcaliphilum TaxID=392018 RepID=UPI00200B3B52|nr:ABC transporter permease [Methanobacterium alcaliphilum]MCK9150515.1 ABC transporter permease [Methanobacterium alcaliphilum]
MLGIAIGIATILGLGLITDGLSESTQNALTEGAADFSVVAVSSGPGQGQGQGGGMQGGPGGSSQQLINQTTVDEIASISGVESVTGVLRSNMFDDSTNSTNQTDQSSTQGPNQASMQMPITILGIDSQNLEMEDVEVTNGTTYSSSDEVIIGKTAANSLNKTIGDSVSISNKSFEVVGIYETGDTMQDGGIIMSLSSLQDLTNNTGKVSFILVKASDSSNANSLAETIENKYSNLTTTTSLSGMQRMNQGLDIINTGAWAVSLLAILIGGIVVVITMVKSVSERTREIGVLKAVGWPKQSVLLMIIAESVVMAVIASVIGIIIGVGCVELLSMTNLIPFIQPAYSATLFLKALIIGILMGIIGGLYPAYRASKLAPTEALRYE